MFYLISLFGFVSLSQTKGVTVECPPDGDSCDLRMDSRWLIIIL